MENAVPRAITPEGIRETRKALHLSQSEFAAYLGRISKKKAPQSLTISRWERGTRTPAKEYVPMLALAARRAQGRDDGTPGTA
jgi:DNA-binding transcriptional regulator YiaG